MSDNMYTIYNENCKKRVERNTLSAINTMRDALTQAERNINDDIKSGLSQDSLSRLMTTLAQGLANAMIDIGGAVSALEDLRMSKEDEAKRKEDEAKRFLQKHTINPDLIV